MRALILIVLAAAALVACDKPAPKRGGGAVAASAAANAADVYRNAFTRMGTDQALLIGSVTFTDQGAGFDAAAPGSREQAFVALKGKQDVAADLIKAGEIESCDFGLPRPKGDGAGMQEILEFSKQVRGAARFLNADAARLWTEGDVDGAVARMAALYRLSAHVSGEPVVLVGLTNVAVLTLADQTALTMAAGAGGRTLSSEQREKLLGAVERLDSTRRAWTSEAG